MDDLCSIGTRELAQFCCVCKYPLPLFCEEHIKEHEVKAGFHFTLPLKAKWNISSEEILIQVREWLSLLSHHFDILRDRVAKFSQNEEKIDAVYHELQQHLDEIRIRFKEQFSVAKAQFHTAVEAAIQEIRDHALETKSFIPFDPFSQLIWSHDTARITAYEFYTIQANSVKEDLESAFQVTLHFEVPGFEHLKVGPSLQSRYSTLQKENSDLVALIKVKDHLLAVANSNIAALKQRLSTFEEVKFGNQVEERDIKVVLQPKPDREQKHLLGKEREERQLPVEALDSAKSLQEPIGVLEGEVKYFDVATSQWYPLFELHPSSKLKRVFHKDRRIQVSDSASTTFIPPNRIFVCGGGASLEDACISHIGNTAYMLEEDGSVYELPDMNTRRYCHGITWDPARESVYVFAGFDDGHGNSYAELRTSEKFKDNQWTFLPNMYQTRSRFNPCWHDSLVYLCGGHTTFVETYDPQSNSFTLQDFTLPEDTATTAVSECGVLTVFSYNYISKLQHGRFTHQQHENYGPWSNYTPVLRGGVVYLVKLNEKCCRGVDLETGGVVMDVSFE